MWQSAVKRFVWSVDQKGVIETEVHYLPFQIHSMFKFTNITIALNFLSIYWICWFVQRLKLAIDDNTVWLSSPDVWKWRNPASFQRAAAAEGRGLPRGCCLAGSLFRTRSLWDRCWFWESGCRCWLLSHLCIRKHIMCLFIWTSQYWLWKDSSPNWQFPEYFSIISGLFFFSCDDF